MPHEISHKKRVIYFIVFSVLFLLCIPIIVLYSMGYTIDSTTFGLSGRGGIYVMVQEPGVNVYVGDDLKKTTSLFQKEVLVKGLRPKEYLVVVGSDEFWPWAKTVNVSEGEVSPLYPLLLPKELAVTVIPKADEMYAQVLKLFAVEPKASPVAAKNQAQVSTNLGPTSSTVSSEVVTKVIPASEIISRRNMRVWKDGNLVFAHWAGGNGDIIPPYFCYKKECTDTIPIFEANMPIGRIDFYPDRDDVIIMTLDRSIYAVETDVRTYHNFYPLYQGTKPDWRVEDSTIYIKDGDVLSSIEL